MPETVQMAPSGVQEDAAEVPVWRDAVVQVLKAASENVVAFGKQEVESFQRRMSAPLEQLRASPDASQTLIAASVLSETIRQHSASTQRQIDSVLAGSRAAVQEFLRHLERICGEPNPAAPDSASEDHVASIAGPVAELRRKLEALFEAGQWGELPTEIAQHLGPLTEQAEAGRRQAVAEIARLKDRIAQLEAGSGRAASTARPVSPIDPGTGLPIRAEAEEALRGLTAGSEHAYAAVFYVHRMQLTNARFGEALGNQVILFCSQHIATEVTHGDDALYRWTGPAFVAILHREASHLSVEREMQRVMSLPLSRFVETHSRSVYLPIKMTSHLIPLFDTDVETVLNKIERFISSEAGTAVAG